MKSFGFNLNSTIRVKLNDKGYKRMADRHNELAALCPQIGTRTVEDCCGEADPEGYKKFQAWEFMQIFGPVTGLGFETFFDLEIIIQESDLRAVES